MTNEDYQLEELENAAVKKSNTAKRVALTAGIAATAAGTTFAATQIPFGSEEPETVETLTEEDLESVAETGANQVEAEPEPEPVQEVHHYHHYVEEPVETPAEDEVDVSFDKTTHFYDDDQNLVMTMEEGTVNGNQFKLLDVDGDMRADYFAYDANGNGIIEDNEITELYGNEQIAMGNATTQHEDIFLALDEPPVDPIDPPYDIYQEKDLAEGIHNDFEDEKTGEVYSHDYAENNENYNNNGDIENYSAGMSEDTGYAYEDDVKDEFDYAYEEETVSEGEYEYDGLAQNDDLADDMFDDYGSDDSSLDIM